MNPSILLARLRQSRRASLTVFAITLAALVVAAVWFLGARSALADAYANLGTRTQVLNEAQVREQEARLRVDHARSARDLLAAAHAHGLRPTEWGERLINLRQSQMTRAETDALLAAVTRDENRIFGAETFELSVTRPEEGLFTTPESRDRAPAPLSLSLRGSLLFRTGGGPGPSLPSPGAAP